MKEKYPYLYETHLHTMEGSKCGKSTAAEMVDAAKAFGYTGIFVTDHNWGGNCRVVRDDYEWEDYIREYSQGYEEAKKRGDEVGLQVFWGYEAGFAKGLGCDGTEVLIYGLSPRWLMDHPEVEKMTITEHCAYARAAGAMVVHAHPFRERSYIPEVRLFPDSVDAVEAVNAAHSGPGLANPHPEFDERALAYAREHDFPLTAGSDIHRSDLPGGGVAFPERLESVQDYCRRILSGKDYVLTNGIQVFDSHGDLLPEEPDWKQI